LSISGRGKHTALLALTLLAGFASNALRAQQFPAQDSTSQKKDSSAIQDTLRARFIPAMGSLRGIIDSSSLLHRSNMVWTDARNLSDLSWRIPGFFFRELGEAGKPNQLNGFGTDWRGISVLLDGRPLTDPITGVYNLHGMPLEFVEQVEVFSGADGFLYGQQGTATTLNFVSRQFNTLRPITAIRYAQSASETILTDGLFTQNLARGVNLMVGFERNVSDGRFRNAALDAWSIRTRLRYNATERLNFSLTDLYTKSVNGMNGGVDLSQPTPVFDNISASVKNRSASEKLTRRDLTFGALARLFDDSTSNTNINLYFSSMERDFEDAAVPLNDHQTSSYRGLRIFQTYSAGAATAEIGFDYQSQRIDRGTRFDFDEENMRALFGRLTMRLGDFLVPSFSARNESFRGKTYNSISSRVTLHLGPHIQLFAGWSESSSLSSLAQPGARDTFFVGTISPPDIQHRYVEAGLRFAPDSSFQVAVQAYRRITRDGVAFSRSASSSIYATITMRNVPEAKTEGIVGSALFRLGNIEGYGRLTFTNYSEGDTAKTLIPQLVLAGELTYRGRFFDDALDARFGVRSKFMTQHKGMELIPLQMLYVENTDASPGQFSVMDLFAVLHIGDTFVTVTWENVLNANYFITPVYPMPGRNLRLGITWIFID
jgi:outer membrane cobalamin receptor